MNKPTYSGAYSRRRYSNAAQGSFSTNTSASAGGGSGSDTVTVTVSVNNAAMGSINAFLAPSSNATGKTDAAAVQNRDGSKTLVVPRGSTVRVVASAANGYVLDHFEGTPTPPATNTAAFSVVANADCQFAAVFRVVPPPTTHKLTVVYNSTMGSVAANGLAPEPGYPDGNGRMCASMQVLNGNSVTLTATPKQGCRFVRWEGCTVGGRANQTRQDNPVTEQIFADRTLTAVFDTEGNGSSDPNPDQGDSPNPDQGDSPIGPGAAQKAVAFAKKWWWALLIAAFLIYDSRKGGRR